MTDRLNRILLLSTSTSAVAELRSILQSEAFTLEAVSSVQAARDSLEQHGLPQGLIIDLQGLDSGLDFCNEMSLFAGLPVIVLGSALLDQSTIIQVFKCSDTYLRPEEAEPRELASRVTRLLSRVSLSNDGARLKAANDIEIDFIHKIALIDGEAVLLTDTEVSLLHVLTVHQGMMVDNQTLIERVWRGASAGNENALRVHMHRLRKKLKWRKSQQNPTIKTVRGIGYLLQRVQ